MRQHILILTALSPDGGSLKGTRYMLNVFFAFMQHILNAVKKIVKKKFKKLYGGREGSISGASFGTVGLYIRKYICYNIYYLYT